MYGMKKTTVYLPDELKAQLLRASVRMGCTEAELIRQGVRLVVEQCPPPDPTIPLYTSNDPHMAERVDEYLKGFGED